MANSSVMSQNRRRPKRQRTPTTIYTDDNPMTFTTKKKKGQNNDKDDGTNFSPRASPSKPSPTAAAAAADSWSTIEESISMPPPPPVVKRGPGRPPRRKSAEKMILSLPGGKSKRAAAAIAAATATSTYTTTTTTKNTTKTVIPDSSASSVSTTAASSAAAALVEQQVVTKRKRGRPPKNRSKETPVVDHNASESDQDTTGNNTMHDSMGNTGSSTMDLQDADGDPVVDDDTINKNETAVGRRRSSLPESSTTAAEVKNEKERRRRSLDSIISAQKKKDAENTNNYSTAAIKVASTRNSGSNNSNSNSPQRRAATKLSSGTTPLLFRAARARANSSASWTPPQQDIGGSFVNHSVTVVPILPPVLVHDNDDCNDSTVVHNKTNNNETNSTTKENPPIHDDDENDRTGHNSSSSSESSTISRELKSKYPVVFDKGVPKASSSIAPPFSSTSQLSSGTFSTSSSKHKSNQSQHHQLSQLPTWSPLYNPPVFFEDDYDRETGHLDISNTIPVTRHITAMAVRKPDHDYLVLGDSVGFVTIYSLAKDNINLPIAQLESVACQQRGKAEQERLRADYLRKRSKQQTKGSSAKGSSGSSKSFFSNSTGARPGTPNPMQTAFASGPTHVRSILIDTSDTTIHALGMIENRVVLATSEELECMDVPSGTSLWVCPLSANRFVTSLDMHLNTFDVLVSCSKTNDSTSEAVTAPISPLMLLQHSDNNVEICDANSPMLVRSPSCSAIWDIGAPHRLLFIALSANRQEHELVLVSGGSIDSWKVACKTKIPTKTSSSAASGVAAATKLSQSPGGVYTLVASSRGIRLYQTESLQLIHVYGDQLALHGQSVMWKDCWLAGSFFSETNKNITKAAKGLPSQWLQCDDWLGERIKETTHKSGENAKTKNDTTPDLAPYIIGVPHTKGPKELCENLHVWKVEHPSVVPMMSIPLPNKAEGALGLVGSGNKSSSRNNNTGATEDCIVLVTDEGEGHLLLPKMESNFAGIEFPPGYQVVTNNIEYIEDEDATDHVIADNDIRGKKNPDDETTEDMDVDLLGHGEDDESMDEELKEAMRQSLLEHKKHEITLEAMKHDADVDIFGTNAEKNTEFLPCRPEPYLRQMINTVVEGEETPENEIEEDKGVKLDFAASSGKMSNFNGINEAESSTNEAIKPKLTDAIFISKVLEMMPNMPKSKPLEEDCLSFTTTKVVVAVNPILPIRAPRGRKSRAANLETMLKASINPYLQSMMLSRQSAPVNGQGSRLRPVKNVAKKNSLAPPDKSTNKLKTFAKTFSGAAESKPYAGTERVNGESYSSSDSSVAALNAKRSISPRQATNDDEAAVVMGLLGLSPCHTTNVPSNTFFPSDPKDANNGQPKGSTYLNSSSLSLLGVKNEDNQVVSAVSSERGSVVEGSECMTETVVEKSKLGIIDQCCSACRGRHVIHSCGKRSLPIDYEELARAERERKENEEEEKKRMRAEKRRLADQKRREAKKQKQLELEEQRLHEENESLEVKQRLRLQEDFASQDMNQRRRQQIVASYANHASIDTSHQTRSRNEINSSIYARSQKLEVTHSSALTQSIANGHQITAAAQAASSFNKSPQPQTSAGVFEQGTQLLQQPAPEVQGGIPYQNNRSNESGNHVLRNENSVSVPSTTSNEHVAYSIPAQSPFAEAASSSVSTNDFADALVALANLAETLPVTETHVPGGATASNEPEWPSSYASSGKTTTSYDTRDALVNQQQYNAPSVSASHGFSVNANDSNDDSAPSDLNGEVKRGIPSYAAILGKSSNVSPNDVASAMSNTVTTASSFYNGYTHETGESPFR